MTQTSDLHAGATTVIEPVDEYDQRAIDLGTALIEAAMDDASVLDGIPNGATLVLLPNDDPAYVEEVIAVGLIAIRRGRDVIFRHTRTSFDPALSERDVAR